MSRTQHCGGAGGASGAAPAPPFLIDRLFSHIPTLRLSVRPSVLTSAGLSIVWLCWDSEISGFDLLCVMAGGLMAPKDVCALISQTKREVAGVPKVGRLP